MEIRIWLYCIFINCYLIHNLGAKSVSLNELIAAESQYLPKETSSPPKLTGGAKSISLNAIASTESGEQRDFKTHPRKLTGLSKRLSLVKRLVSNGKLRSHKSVNDVTREKIISPLRYRRTYQIKSPLKPKKLKLIPKSRYQRKSLSRKREISGNGNLKPKYIPLLKSLSMLFDNLLSSDGSDSYENKAKKYKRNRYYSEEQFDFSNDWSSKSSSTITRPKPQKKTTTTAPTVPAKIPSVTKSLAVDKDYDHGTVGPNKSLPVLLSRNTFSPGRDDIGTSKRSSTTFDGDIERNITRDNGDNEYNTRNRTNESCAESDEDDTYSIARNDSSSTGHTRTDRHRNNTGNTEDRETVDIVFSKNGTDDAIREVEFQIRGNENESKESVRELDRGLRGHVPEETNTHEKLISNSIQLKDVYEESVRRSEDNRANNKRVIDEGRPYTTENEKNRGRNETMIVINRPIKSSLKDPEKKPPVVLIFDGYSVTRYKNGKNKVAEKSIHVRS